MAKYDQGGGCSCGLYKECLDDCENQSFIRSDRFEKEEPYYKYVVVGEIIGIENSIRHTSFYSETSSLVTVRDYYTNAIIKFRAPCAFYNDLTIGKSVLVHIEGNEISWYTLVNMDFANIWRIED